MNHTLDQKKLSKKNPFGDDKQPDKESKGFKFVSVSCTDLNYIKNEDPKQTKKPNHQKMEEMVDAMKENLGKTIPRQKEIDDRRMSTLAA